MNPVQFKVSSVEEVKTTVKGMTVFNTEQVNTKKQPMFFGKPLGVQRYDSYKYPVFDKLTTQQLGYFWRPEEVSLQKDRGDYQTLRPEQRIFGNWSYNPENYPDNEVPVSVMANDLLTTYKYGWKTSYYQNTHDMKNDEVEEEKPNLENLLSELEQSEEGECESCAV